MHVWAVRKISLSMQTRFRRLQFLRWWMGLWESSVTSQWQCFHYTGHWLLRVALKIDDAVSNNAYVDKVERGRQDPFTVHEDKEVYNGKLHTKHIVKTTPKWMLRMKRRMKERLLCRKQQSRRKPNEYPIWRILLKMSVSFKKALDSLKKCGQSYWRWLHKTRRAPNSPSKPTKAKAET